jgi:benzoyl-CoA reductase/2-hydroxyglutaryl-CoA dehydratase subunit BcrC/BadD/HgdB
MAMVQAALLSRKEYLRQQKTIHGRKLLGVFPATVPREILWAMNVLPVEIWDPPVELSHANAHLQPTICSVVKAGLELILRGHTDDLDGFLFPHTCDSIQNLASLVNNCLEVNKPCYFFYHPKAPYRESSREFYRIQLKRLTSMLERQFGTLDVSALKDRVDQGQHVTDLLMQLYDRRARGALSASNTAFYQTIRRGEYLHPDDFLPLLKIFLAKTRRDPSDGPAIILTGVLPSPPEILTLLDSHGVRVADDDLLNCGRRLLAPAAHAEEPFDALVERYFAMAPCSTRGSSVRERTDHLLRIIDRSGAQGVIFTMVKFCEPELFDVPQLVEAVKQRGVTSLVIESDLGWGSTGQLATRVGAFLEMIG